METATQEPMTQEKIQDLMEAKQPKPREKSWRPVAGGILGIIAGYANILLGGVGLFKGFVGLKLLGLAAISSGVGYGLGVALVALGIVSVIGGMFALARRAYPMSVIGSIASLFPSPAAIAGTLSVVFVGLGRDDFHRA